MPILDRLLPWRWRHKIHAALDAKFDNSRHALIAALNDIRFQLEAQLAARTAEAREQVETRLSEARAEISDLRTDVHDVSQVLSGPPHDAALHRLRAASADVERGLMALKNEIAAQLGFSLHDIASQIADQRLWLERISADFENLPARLRSVPDGKPEPKDEPDEPARRRD